MPQIDDGQRNIALTHAKSHLQNEMQWKSLASATVALFATSSRRNTCARFRKNPLPEFRHDGLLAGPARMDEETPESSSRISDT